MQNVTEKTEYHLGSNFAGAVIHIGDVTIELDTRHNLTIYTNGEVNTLPGPQRRIGDVQPDKTLYAGISPDTGRPLFVMPRPLPADMPWDKAMESDGLIEAYGKKDWRVATKGELKLMFGNAAALGIAPEDNWHWSSEENPANDQDAWVERVGSKGQYVWKGLSLATHLVRS